MGVRRVLLSRAVSVSSAETVRVIDRLPAFSPDQNPPYSVGEILGGGGFSQRSKNGSIWYDQVRYLSFDENHL